MDEPAWVSAHAFYHGNLDDLLAMAVAPLVAELAREGLAANWFFLRYWDGGPHLRLRVLPTRPAGSAEVTELIRRRFSHFFLHHPAAEQMTQQAYARIAPSLARWEQLDTYQVELRPSQTLAFIGYRREHHRYGHGTAIEAVERHFGESSKIALRVLTVGVSLDQRITAACAMLLLTWFSCQPDPAQLAQWLADDPRQLRESEKATPQTVDLARRMRALSALASTSTRTGTLVDWARSVSALRDCLAAEIASGAFDAPRRGWEGPSAIRGTDPPSRAAAVLDICAHLICNRLGLPLATESALRAQAVAAVNELAGERIATDALA
jgi:hypothetical protein